MHSKGELMFPLGVGWRSPVHSVDLDIKLQQSGVVTKLERKEVQ